MPVHRLAHGKDRNDRGDEREHHEAHTESARGLPGRPAVRRSVVYPEYGARDDAGDGIMERSLGRAARPPHQQHP